MKYIYKLGNNANSFSDSIGGISITKSTPFVSEEPIHLHNSRIAKALRGGHLFLDVDEEAPNLDQLDVTTASAKQMSQFTRKEIMDKFNFIDEDDTAEAIKQKTKMECIEYLISIRDDYEAN